MNTAPKFQFVLTAVAALSFSHPASVQAVPTTYHYTGNPFTEVHGVYTTDDFVTAMVTLADPLPSNFDGFVTPTAFTLSDGVQTLTNTIFALGSQFHFVTNARGEITLWDVTTRANVGPEAFIDTGHGIQAIDEDGGAPDFHALGVASGFNFGSPGVWTQANAAPDAGSTLSLMTLTLMALGLVARRFQRAASGLTASGLAEVASWRSATRPASRFAKTQSVFQPRRSARPLRDQTQREPCNRIRRTSQPLR